MQNVLDRRYSMEEDRIMSLMVSIYKREDIDKNLWAHQVLRMFQAQFDKDQVIHELITKLGEQHTAMTRILEIFPRPMTKEESNYIQTGKYE